MKSKLILTSVLLVLLSFSVGWSQSEFTVDHVDGLHAVDTIATGTPVIFYIRLTNVGTGYDLAGITNGFKLHDNESGATWSPPVTTATGTVTPGMFEQGIFVTDVDIDGIGADTIGLGGFRLFAGGILDGFDDIIATIEIQFANAEHCGEFCIDSAFYPPTNEWKWSTTSGPVVPDWGGESCFTIWDAANGTPCGPVENIPPVLASIGAQAVVANNTMSFTVSASDADSDPIALTFTNTDLPVGFGFSDNGDGTGDFLWTPGCTENGTYSGTFMADDGTDTHSEIVTFTVAANGTPNWTVDYDTTVAECGSINFIFSATDPEGGAVTYSATNVPTGAVWTSATGAFDWTTAAGDAAGSPYAVTITATDDCGGTSDYIFDIIVTANADPVWTMTSDMSTAECGNFNFTVVATDDGGTPTYSISGLPTGATFVGDLFDWTTTAGDAAGSPYTVTFTAEDACGGTADDVVVLTVTANGDPVWTATGNKTVAECSNLAFTVVATDDGGTPNYSASGLPTGATFVGDAFDWTPGAGDAAGSPYTVTFTASDACGGTADDIVVITVTANQNPTVAAGNDITVKECEAIAFTVTSSDPDGTTPTVVMSGTAHTGTFDAGTGEFTWTPDASEAGTYNINFTATDDCGGSALDAIILTVTGNAVPVLTADSVSVTIAECDVITFNVAATDADGNFPAITMYDPDPSFTDNGDGTASLTGGPSHGDAGAGADSLVFFATDECGEVDTLIIPLTITANPTPVFGATADVTFTQGDTVVVNVSATDGEAMTLTLDSISTEWVFVDNGDGTGSFTWNSTLGTPGGSFDVIFHADDGCSVANLTVNFDIATDVPGQKETLPEVFSLSQNYPNPFNPTTSIKYSLGENSHVTLGVFNVLGQQIKTLVDRRESPGQYEVTWDAYSDNGVRVSSGIYFYKLITETFSETRKMILLK